MAVSQLVPLGHSCEDDGWCQFIHPETVADGECPAAQGGECLCHPYDEGDFVEVGVCICGAYGRAGTVHVAKPSPGEPPEECGVFG